MTALIAATTSNGINLPEILLSSIVWAPLLACLVVLVMPDRNDEQRGRIRTVALGGAGLSFFLTTFFAMLGQIALAEGGGLSSASEENRTWFQSFAFTSNYHLTADGITLPLLLLSTLVFGCVFFHAWKVHERVRLYVALLLLLETATNGVLCSADLVLFVMFWGLQILPMYVLVRVWGGSRRHRAAAVYLGFSLISLILIIATAALVIVKAGQHSSDMSTDLQNLLGPVAAAGFWLSLAAFAIAMGVFPLHTWMVDSQSQASPGVAAVASGALLMLGGYGLMRITLVMFPQAAHRYSLVIAALAVAGAIWGSVGMLRQDDLRRFIAYSNIPQLSLVLLAISAQTSVALVGAILLLAAHGFAAVILTLVSGSLEERARTRSIRTMGGLAAQAPRLAAFWFFAVLSIIGIPILAGFTADFMVFAGSFPSHRIATVLVMASLVVTTGGLLWVAHRVFLGPPGEQFARVRDASTLELTCLIPIVSAMLLFGLRPGAVTPVIANGVLEITTRLNGG